MLGLLLFSLAIEHRSDTWFFLKLDGKSGGGFAHWSCRNISCASLVSSRPRGHAPCNRPLNVIFGGLTWCPSLDMTKPVELLTSNLVCDSAWAVDHFTEVFIGYWVSVVNPCYVTKTLCFKCWDSMFINSFHWPNFTCIHMNGDSKKVKESDI